jgi:hypothetical protein
MPVLQKITPFQSPSAYLSAPRRGSRCSAVRHQVERICRVVPMKQQGARLVSAWLWFFVGWFFAPITGLVLLKKNSRGRSTPGASTT